MSEFPQSIFGSSILTAKTEWDTSLTKRIGENGAFVAEVPTGDELWTDTGTWGIEGVCIVFNGLRYAGARKDVTRSIREAI